MKLLSTQEIEKIAVTLKALSNPTRFKIVCLLNESSKTWLQLMFGLTLNPKSLRDYLRILKREKIVQKHAPVGYELTDKGKFLLEKLSECAKILTKGD